jgi:preprotein translocase, SecE subunit, bacterial
MAVEGKVKIKEKNKTSRLASITSLYRGFKAEAKRITWPTKKEIKKATTAVFVICAAYLLYVSVIDIGFKYLFDLVLGIN